MDTTGLGGLGAFTSQRVEQPATVSIETARAAKGLRVAKGKNLKSKNLPKAQKGDTPALMRAIKDNG